jgi:hypothetical protein
MLKVGPPLCHVDTCTRPGCSPENGCQGHAWREIAPAHYQAEAEDLVARAARYGLVITVEQRSLKPLAMGHFETVISVRQRRAA